MEEAEERFVQVAPVLDLLLVVDNSCSMLEEQESLAASIPEVVGSYLEHPAVDWHVGVISTDMDDPTHSGKLQYAGGYSYVDASTLAPVDVLAEMVVMGTDGSGNERGREAVYAALADAPFGNAGFYREQADLHILVVSDEEDRSTMPMADFVEWLEGWKPEPGTVSWSSFVSPVGCCSGGVFAGDEQAGLTYLELTEYFGGIELDIRAETDEWSASLLDLVDTTLPFQEVFPLAGEPDPSTVQVALIAYDGAPIDDGAYPWTYDLDRNSVVFTESPPPAGAEVVVTYAEAEAG